MTDCEQFYQLRDRRTVEYLARAIGDLVPVHVAIDAATAATACGQLALLALASWGLVIGIAVVARAALIPIAAMMVRR